ncbi:MAG: hypothetical protein PF574_07400 [Candidatus Delongbacteria bacterium]|jgi:MFS family permease|nr:hypothetical protein [Candidatus Delongbacteria bacterium]
MNQFLVLLAVSFSFNSLFIPLYNNLFQKHFDSKVRGKIFGITISLSTLIVIIFSYVAGRILDNDENNFRFIMIFAGICGFLGTAISFLTLSIFPLTLFISSFTPVNVAIILVFVAYFIYSFGMAGVNITWNISSIFFAGKEDSSMYQSIHVSATGIRGLLAPLLGLFIYRSFGIQLVFFVSFLFIFTASITSYLSYLKRSSIKKI